MNKKALLFLLVGLFIASSGLATQARLSGLGDPVGLIEDDTDVFIYPARIFDHNGNAIGELYRASDSAEWSMSANIPIINNIIGVSLNRNTMINDKISEIHYPEGTVLNIDLSKSIEFNYGFMSKFALGFATSSDYFPDTTYSNLMNNSLEIDRIGNFFSFFGGYTANDLDFGFRMEVSNVKDIFDENSNAVTDSEDSYFDMEYNSIAVNGRKIYRLENNLDFIVKAGISLDKTKLKVRELDDFSKIKVENQSIMVDVALSMQYKPNNKNRIIFGVTPFMYNPINKETTEHIDDVSNNDKWELSTLVFPKYNLAIESDIFQWLTSRMGANQSYSHRKIKFDGTNYELYDKEFYMNLGLTFSFGNFCLDTVLEQELLFEGPDFIGGNANGLASEVSVKYKF